MDISTSIQSQHPLDQDSRIGSESRNRNYRFHGALSSFVNIVHVVFPIGHRSENPNWLRSESLKLSVLWIANSTPNIKYQLLWSMPFSPNSTKSLRSGRASTSIELRAVQSADSGTTLWSVKIGGIWRKRSCWAICFGSRYFNRFNWYENVEFHFFSSIYFCGELIGGDAIHSDFSSMYLM